MKIQIIKSDQTGRITLKLTASSASNPISHEFTNAELEAVIKLMKSAMSSSKFSMSYETE